VRLGVFFAENLQNQPGAKVLIALALIEDGKFISVYGYTWKIFHHILVLLLRWNCD